MTSELVAYPSADWSGVFQRDPPLAVDGASYQEPNVLAVVAAGYGGGDSASDAFVPDVFELPDVEAALGDIQLVSTDELINNGTFDTSFDIPVSNAAAVLPGDIIECVLTTQELSDPGNPSVSGYTQVYSLHNGVGYVPHQTLFYVVASGGEEGSTITATWSTSCRGRGFTRVWRNVDNDNPYDVAEQVDYNYANPDPPSITTVTDKAMITVTCSGNKAGGTPATISSGYTLTSDSSAEDRSHVNCHKVLPTAGTDDPAAYAWSCDNSTVVTLALRPSSNSGLALYLLAAVTDGTETAELSSGVALGERNEIQTVQSNETAGTITLTFNGDTTAAIAFDALASTVETELEALSSIGAGNVSVSGGPLDTNAVVVEFISALAGADQPLITSADDVDVYEDQKGYAEQTFSLETSTNIPRAGNNFEPQVHLWSLSDPAPYLVGQPVDVTFADHDNLHSWSAVLIVTEGADLSDLIGVVGTETNGQGTVAPFGSVTPSAPGAKVLAWMAKASSSLYSTVAIASDPARYDLADRGEGDAVTLAAWISPPLPAAAEMPQSVNWSGTEEYTTGLATINPDADAGSLDLYEAVNDDTSETDWIEIAGAAGSMYEVLQLDLSALPGAAVLVGASIEFAHYADVANSLSVVLVGINDDDTISPGSALQAGYTPSALNEAVTVTTGEWREFADGSSITEYSRLGVALISSSRNPNLGTHRVLWIKATVSYEEGGPVVANVAGPSTPGDTISWTYQSTSGLAQSHYQIMVIQGSGQDPDSATIADNPMGPSTGEIVYDSGRKPGPLTRSVTITDAPLSRGTCTVAVRAWARLASGVLVVSDWDTANFDITGSPPTSGTQSTQPAFDESTGGVDVELSTPASISRAWLLRSEDSGSTYTITGPYSVDPSTTETVTDWLATIMATTTRYQVVFDAGPMTETSPPVNVGSGDISTLIVDQEKGWYFIVPEQPALSSKVEVVARQRTDPWRSVESEQPGNLFLATSEPLATRFSLTVRCRSNADRETLEAILFSGQVIRLVDVFGRSWFVKPPRGRTEEMLVWAPLSSESTGLRDAHETSVELAEVYYSP